MASPPTERSTGETIHLGAWVWPVRLMLLALSAGCGTLFGVSLHAYWELGGSFGSGDLSIVFIAFIEGLLFLPRAERFEMIAARSFAVLVPFLSAGAASVVWVAQEWSELIFPLGFLITVGWWIGGPILLAMLMGRRFRGLVISRIGAERRP
ncbi:MAG: hypothetical protein O2822_00615 [Chloroflexi bacterium]|nr:hypothetical protein [Chloroflexota bacterium]